MAYNSKKLKLRLIKSKMVVSMLNSKLSNLLLMLVVIGATAVPVTASGNTHIMELQNQESELAIQEKHLISAVEQMIAVKNTER